MNKICVRVSDVHCLRSGRLCGHLWGRLSGVIAVMLLICGACVRTEFEKDLKARRWIEAARTFEMDSSLHNEEKALYQAALLHSFPNKATYNPTLARTLFQRLIRLHPNSPLRHSATDHLASLAEIENLRQDSSRRADQLQQEMARLFSDRQALLMRLDSLTRRTQTSEQQSEQFRKQIAKLEADLKERDEQVRTLRAELAKLKEIDLNPNRPR